MPDTPHFSRPHRHRCRCHQSHWKSCNFEGDWHKRLPLWRLPLRTLLRWLHWLMQQPEWCASQHLELTWWRWKEENKSKSRQFYSHNSHNEKHLDNNFNQSVLVYHLSFMNRNFGFLAFISPLIEFWIDLSMIQILVQNWQLLVLVLDSESTRRVVDKCVIVPHNCHKNQKWLA